MKKSRYKRPLFTVATILLLAGLLVGAWFVWNRHENQRSSYKGPHVKITTGVIQEYAALILVADQKGYFAKQGLDVELRNYASGPDAVADLLAGKLDMAMASDFAGVRNSFNGQDLKVLANVSKSEAFFLLARNDHGIHKIADLKGKTIGLTQKTVGEFYLGQFLTFNKLNLNSAKIVDMPQASLITALEKGKVDAAVLFEPNAYNAQKILGDQTTRWSVQSNEILNSLLYTTSKLTNEQPDAIGRYMKALVEAEKFVQTHDAESRRIVATQLHYSDEYIDYIWPKFSFHVTLEQELLLNMDDEARWAVENGLVKTSKVPNYLHFIYFNGLKAAKPEAITIIH